MNLLRFQILPMLFALAACGDTQGLRQVAGNAGRAAESVRIATEHMAARGRANDDARQAQVFEDAERIDQQKLAQDPELAARETRYEVRRDGANWSVYDLETGATARIGAASQGGLNRSRADEVAYSLQLQENFARQQATTGLMPKRTVR